jgi:hypothetical protein
MVCGVFLYGVYFAKQLQNINWVWVFGIIAVLFNPVIPIHLNRDIWTIIDVTVAVIFLFSINYLKKSDAKDNRFRNGNLIIEY